MYSTGGSNAQCVQYGGSNAQCVQYGGSNAQCVQYGGSNAQCVQYRGPRPPRPSFNLCLRGPGMRSRMTLDTT